MTADQLREESLKHLSGESLLPFIEWWDLFFLEHRDSCKSLLREGVVRMTLGLEEILVVKPDTPVQRTLKAAADYLQDQGEPRWSDFVKSSTMSYPFGPGDGCFGIKELGHGPCGPGSGCRSGIGFLFSVSRDRARVQECLRTVWRDWR